jgi:hypothetical protein
MTSTSCRLYRRGSLAAGREQHVALRSLLSLRNLLETPVA